nr:hypothetical protein [Desulfobacterales bacterium]
MPVQEFEKVVRDLKLLVCPLALGDVRRRGNQVDNPVCLVSPGLQAEIDCNETVLASAHDYVVARSFSFCCPFDCLPQLLLD